MTIFPSVDRPLRDEKAYEPREVMSALVISEADSGDTYLSLDPQLSPRLACAVMYSSLVMFQRADTELL